ncbi:MAG: hypothetical protein LBV27_07865 [Oscillospiraceae bacterium]|nr:hypothetical protein [Oscillospiraceae bacterium]
MTKRIFRTMSLLISLTVLVFSVLWGLAFFRQFGAQVKDGLKTLRVSIIDQAGNVTFDNMAELDMLGNHLDRPEVADAIRNGTGESERFSDTLGETTHYYAVRMASGDIVRLALETDSVFTILYGFVPLLLVCLLLASGVSFFLARRLTKRIVAPINNIDLDAPELGNYDELLPLVKRIETQKRELSAQLGEIESRAATISAITGNMKEGLLLLDTNGKVLLANESVHNILAQDIAVGNDMITVYRDADFLAQAKRCLSGEKTEMVLCLNNRYYSVYFSPVFEKAQIGGAVILFIDITERYAAEAQRKEFSANVSHELKTPLTTIAALSEMIADGTAKDKDIRPFADKIKSQSSRLINIIDDIIKLSEFDEGGIPKEHTRFNLYDLAETVIGSLDEKAKERHVTVDLRGESQQYMVGNMRMIDELLFNLVDNAIKYNYEGGRVDVALSGNEGEIKLAVEDTGVGIPKEHLSHIFERFYRVDKSRSKKTGGTGLGLSIVKHIAEFHGGRVEVESTVGEGTAITITFQQQE